MKTLIRMKLAVCLLGVTMAQAQIETRVYELKWRSAEEISEILRGFSIRLETSPSFNTLTVAGEPEKLALVEGILEKFDVAARDFELQFYLLKASSQEGGIKNGIPEKIAEVIGELSSLTKYKSFELIDAPNLRASEGKRAEINGQGAISYNIAIARNAIIDSDGETRIRFDPIEINFRVPVGYKEGRVVYGGHAGVRTSLTVADQETVVLGASRLKEADKDEGVAVVTILTAKLL